MSVLCIILFARRDKVLSRSWLGFGAVVTVLLAIMASFGLLFTIGVPFTALTPLLPFIMFGEYENTASTGPVKPDVHMDC